MSRAALAVGGLMAVLAAYWLTPPTARLDDSYIALHSARVLLSGSDPIFNVPPLVGITSPAYVALVTAILAAGVWSGDVALRLANALGLVAFASAVWYAGQTLSLTPGRRLALLVMALASGATLFNLTNGLETGWAMAVLTFAIGCAYAGRLIPVALAAGVLPFLRPDLTPAAAVVLVYTAHGRSRREQTGALMLALLAAAPWLIWMRFDTGEWITQTIRAKQLFYAQGCLPWPRKLATVVGATSAALAKLFPLSVGLLTLGRPTLGRAGILSIAICLLAYFMAYPGALAPGFFRYLYPMVVPWLCFGLAHGLTRVGKTGVAVTAAIALVATRLAVRVDDHAGEYAREVVASSKWLDANVPSDAIVLVHDAGGVSEFAHRRAVDLVGLKTPSSIAAHARWTWPSCGVARRTAVGAIARESGASYFVAFTGWDDPLREGLEAEGFVLTPVRRPPPGDGGGYSVYRFDAGPGMPKSSGKPLP